MHLCMTRGQALSAYLHKYDEFMFLQSRNWRRPVIISMTTPIHFFHANGFPSETYKNLLSNIEGDIHSPISILGKNINSVLEG